MRPFPNSSPLFGLMALLRSMCSKTCHAADAASMVAAFPPGAHDVVVSEYFFCLAINFLGLFILQGSSDHCCSEGFLSFAH